MKNTLFALRTLILRPVVLKTLSIFLVFTFILSMTFSFSANSLPGDFLYPVKCFCEKAQLFMTFSNEGKAELHLKLADRRTEDFILTFKKEEKINKELLKSMLGENNAALEYCKCLPDPKSTALLSKVKECSRYQLKTLQNIKPMVCDSDQPFVSEAINECVLRCSCVDR